MLLSKIETPNAGDNTACLGLPEKMGINHTQWHRTHNTLGYWKEIEFIYLIIHSVLEPLLSWSIIIVFLTILYDPGFYSSMSDNYWRNCSIYKNLRKIKANWGENGFWPWFLPKFTYFCNFWCWVSTRVEKSDEPFCMHICTA